MTGLAIIAIVAGVVLIGVGLVTFGWLIACTRYERSMEELRTALVELQRRDAIAVDERDARAVAAGQRAVARVLAEQVQRGPGPRHAARYGALVGVTDAFDAITSAETWETSNVD